MSRTNAPTRLAILAAGLLLTAGLAGCAGSDGQRADASPATGDRYERYGHSTGYPFRPAPQYRLDDLDELSGPEGYTAGY